MLAFLLGCGLRRSELIGLKLSHLQKRDDHWAIIDLYGKGGHIRTVPVPAWVKVCLDEWLTAAKIEDGVVFRCVSRTGKVWGSGITEKVVWWWCVNVPRRLELKGSRRMISAVPVPGYVIPLGANWNKSNSCSDIARSRRPSVILDLVRDLCMPSTTG